MTNTVALLRSESVVSGEIVLISPTQLGMSAQKTHVNGGSTEVRQGTVTTSGPLSQDRGKTWAVRLGSVGGTRSYLARPSWSLPPPYRPATVGPSIHDRPAHKFTVELGPSTGARYSWLVM